MIMTTKEIGDLGENLAAKYLKKNRYKILDRNIYFSKNVFTVCFYR